MDGAPVVNMRRVALQRAESSYAGIAALTTQGARGTATFARRYPVGFAGAVILTIMVILAVAAPVISPHEPRNTNLDHLKEAPSSSFFFGTDYAGRDIFSRLLHGGRVSLSVAVLSVLLGTTTGAIFGVASGYLGGSFDMISQRLLEMVMSFPALILGMILVVAIGSGFWPVVIAIAITRVPFGVRVVRSVALTTKEQDYVTAARAIGVPAVRIMSHHIAPQCMAPYLVLATAHLGVSIIIEASLGFIGVGVPPPTPTWGNMLGEAVSSSLSPLWWLVVFPGVAISLVVLSFNLFGDGLRDALDPRLRGT